MVMSLHELTHLFHSEYDLMGMHELVEESIQQMGFTEQGTMNIVITGNKMFMSMVRVARTLLW